MSNDHLSPIRSKVQAIGHSDLRSVFFLIFPDIFCVDIRNNRKLALCKCLFCYAKLQLNQLTISLKHFKMEIVLKYCSQILANNLNNELK